MGLVHTSQRTASSLQDASPSHGKRTYQRNTVPALRQQLGTCLVPLTAQEVRASHAAAVGKARRAVGERGHGDDQDEEDEEEGEPLGSGDEEAGGGEEVDSEPDMKSPRDQVRSS